MSDELQEPMPPPEDAASRRQFLRGLGSSLAATGAAVVVAERPAAAAPSPEPPEPPQASGNRIKGTVRALLHVNGAAKSVDIEARTTLLDALRDRLDITGPKKICDRGSCGGCTVLLDGQPVYACMMLAVDAQGKKVETVEGFGSPENMSPVQQAFVDKDGLMCGYCTPGFVTSVTALLRKNANPTLDQVKAACSGNLCRCGTYPRVFEAALAAAKKMRGG